MKHVLLVSLSTLILACSKPATDKTLEAKDVPQDAVGMTHSVSEEFPIPELTQENVKVVNDILMEQMRDELIAESRDESIKDSTLKALDIEPVKKPVIEVDIQIPEFSIGNEADNPETGD